MIEGTYEQFAPYWDANLAVQSDPIQGQLIYLDEKEFPRAKDARPADFIDNSFAEGLKNRVSCSHWGWQSNGIHIPVYAIHDLALSTGVAGFSSSVWVRGCRLSRGNRNCTHAYLTIGKEYERSRYQANYRTARIAGIVNS